MRVHELARELDVPSKELLGKLRELGVSVKSHMSAVDDETAALIREEHARPPADADTGREPRKEETPSAVPEPPPALPAQEKAPEKEEPSSIEAGTGGEPVIRIRGSVVVKELAEKLGLRPNQVIAELMSLNVLASINQRVDINTATAIAEKHGFKLEHEKRAAAQRFPKKTEEHEEDEEDRPEYIQPRPPVVTLLGHVDHGKTSLLDRIRHTAVVDDEFGGITQHIGASTVNAGGRSITFLDTPGHAAFTAMRARGAHLTDIAVIVIAADDGVMPQTEEAIKHAQAAGVTLVIAVNKTDLPGADVERVKQQLQQMGLTPEDWGGEIICCEVSAATGKGIDHLLEMILLQSEMMELKADPGRRAKGFVIEARLEPGMGPTANLLVTSGTLKITDAIVCGRYWGRVRALMNDHGTKIKSAPPSTPVKCLGLSGAPEAGTAFRVRTDEKSARAAAAREEEAAADTEAVSEKKTSLESLFEQLEEQQKAELRIILKADTRGSAEAVGHSLNEIKSSKVSLKIMLSGTGNVTVNDVMLASASDAVILGFHVSNEPGVASRAKHEGVEIRLHNVIYEMVDEVREAMTGLLAPKTTEKSVGKAEVKQAFGVGKNSKAAGCLVVSGTVRPAHRVRVKRGEETLAETSIQSLKRFQNFASEVKETQECGVRLNNFDDFKEGDVLEFYELEEVKQTL
ncbi:MAG: translation initiation factor IF-2 [Kiritimatiellia bacterium]